MVEPTLSTTSQSDSRARRRLFLDIALRRARSGTGSARLFLERRTAERQWPDLTPILASISWAVVGGVATRAYMPERGAQYLDVLVAQADAREVHAHLRSADFTLLQTLPSGGSVWRTPQGIRVDVIESPEPWVAEALSQTQRDAQGLPVLSLPYLVLMKVQSGRTQDLADVARMLGLASDQDRQTMRQVFARWMPEAMEDLESLTTLGELEGKDF